jgi:hypothetical protein
MKTLKNILLINAVSSGATGLGLIAAPAMIAPLFGTSHTTPFVEVGIFLVAFAAFVFFVARKNIPTENAVRLIIALDSSWVIVSLGVIMFQLFNLSTLGYFFIGAVGGWVALMAFLQFNGLKQLSETK